VYQTVIPHDTWYAAEIIEGAKYVFFGAAVFPGKINIYPFSDEDYEKFKRDTTVRYLQ
jgi:predicted cupin superfamily sugar epimerase